MVTERGLRYFL